MKKFVFGLMTVISILLVSSCREGKVTDLQPAPYGVYSEGLIGSVEPQGWIKEFLERQRTGLSGHPEAMCYPYNTCLWDGEIGRERGNHGADWWRYEQTAYYSDGLLRLGYLLDDEEFINKVEKGIHYSLNKISEQGIFGLRWDTGDGTNDDDRYAVWPQAVYFRAIQAYYEATGDESILPVLENHFLGIGEEMFRKERNAINIEGALWTYEHTGNPDLLKHAEAAWQNGDFWIREPERMTEKRLYQHGVTCCEQLKLPLLLYAYTGKKEYLDWATRIERRLEDEDLLPDGIISSSEYLDGKTVNHSHETCDITDYSWTLGYFLMTTGEAKWGDMIEKATFNALPGAIGKDFKTLQYLSSVNQFISTGHSNNNEFMHGRTWMQYRPVHQVECCVGNVHRAMPNYVARMWMMSGPDNLVAAMYGPSKVTFNHSDGGSCTVTEKTEYPFSDDVEFSFRFSRPGSHDMSFSFRMPEWADDLQVELNNEPANFEVTQGGFATIHRNFRTGDSIRIRFVTHIELKDLEGQGSYVERGPLLFTYSIPEECTEDNEEYNYIHGKASANPDFKSWNKVPAAKWNYALCGAKAEKLKVEWTGSSEYPFDEAACRISVPVIEIRDWELDEGVFTPENPARVIPADGAEPTRLDLVPYGTSYLRLTVFPVMKN